MANYNFKIGFRYRGTYDASVTYDILDVVVNSDKTVMYVSRTAGNNGNDLTDVTKWSEGISVKDFSDAETERVSAESARSDAENTRTSNENTRISNEDTRKSNESTRQSNETARKDNEEARQENEEARQTNTATAITNAEAATAKAENVNAEAEGYKVKVTDRDGNVTYTDSLKGEKGNDGSVIFPSVSVDESGYIVAEFPDSAEGTNLEIDSDGYLCVDYPDVE